MAEEERARKVLTKNAVMQGGQETIQQTKVQVKTKDSIREKIEKLEGGASVLILISFVIAAIFAVWWLVFRKEPSRMCGGSFLADEENLTIQEYENLREKYIQRQ